MRVLRIAHHAVVGAWRERERQLIARGAAVSLLSAQRWNEAGRDLELEPGTDRFVTGVRTWGSHPAGFVYDPRPLWRALGEQYDVIDLHEEPYALATAEVLLLRWLRGNRAPVVLYSAQNIPKRYPVPVRWAERAALRAARGAYVCNAEAGRILEEKGLNGAATLVPLGVDTERFRPGDRDAPASAPTIGYIGRLEAHKGVDVLVRAVAAHHGWRLQLTGDGPEHGRLADLAASLGAADRVEFRGFADGEALAQRYRDLDLLAVPSIPTPGWLEQFCRVAVEAMASGVPVVASRTGAIPDVVGDAAVLVEPADPHALGRGIAEALNPPRWRKLRAQGLERSERFTWGAVAEEHLGVYRTIAPQPATNEVHVVIVAYGSPEVLTPALRALDGRYPVTIVDNSSLPQTREQAASFGCHYVDPGHNLGFGAGVNAALASIADRGLGPHDILLLNPDATITPTAIDQMRARLRDESRVGVVGATQTDPSSGAQVRVWWPFPTPWRAWVEAVGLGCLNRARDFAIGSILLLRAETIAQIGGFDERFFLYSEETDWQLRAVDAGWRIVVADVAATHVGGGTSPRDGRREVLFAAAAETYQRKHFGAFGWQLYRAALVVGSGIRAAVLPGQRRAAAAARFAIFRRGPVRCAQLVR